MIYQHRLVVSRNGRLDARNQAFSQGSLAALDAHGSQLIGAWEVWIGPDPQASVWQLRQFESMAAWERHQDSVRADADNNEARRAILFPNVDFCDTAILRPADGMPALPATWPSVPGAAATQAGVFEQRTIWLRPDTARAHHRFYREELLPALQDSNSQVHALFDTLIGPGTTNAGSHRSIELRRFPDMAAWQRWHSRILSDPALRRLTRETWRAHVERMDTVLLRPTDYSLIH